MSPTTEASSGTQPFAVRAAEWAVRLRYGDLPASVRRLGRAQLQSTMGAAIWTLSHPLGETITEAATETDAFATEASSSRTERQPRASPGANENPAGHGVATFVASGPTAPTAAAAGHAALSMAMDFDDSVLGGHTGHSAAGVALAYGEATGANGREVLVASVAATEIAARFGAAAAVGPFRGQQTAYIHAVGAAVARGVLEGCAPETLADAIALALGQPPWPLEPAFLGSDAKVASAAEPIRTGCWAVAAARNGMAGNPQVVEGTDGFLSVFATYPLAAFFDGLGERWHTRTLSVKPYPGCAYVTAPIHAALAVRDRLSTPAAIRRVDVSGSLFTSRVDALAGAYVAGSDSPLAALSFSVPYNVAAALFDGVHSPRQLHPERTGDAERWALADRVTVHHDAKLTLAALESAVPLGAMVRPLGWEVLPYAAKSVGVTTTLRHLPTIARLARRRPLPTDFDDAEKRLGARVRVTLADGTETAATCHHPPGFAGRPIAEIEAIAREKLRSALDVLDRDETGSGDGAPTALATGDISRVRMDPDGESAAIDLVELEGSDPVDLSPLAECVEERL